MRTSINHSIGILGTGSQLGDRVIDNDALSDLISNYDEEASGPFGAWVEKVTHIRERRFLDSSKTTKDLSLASSRQACEMAGIDPSTIQFVIYCSFTYREHFPGDLLRMAEELGCPSAGAFNLGAACAGSVYGLGMAYGLVKAGLYDRVLVVGLENLTRVMNFEDPLTAILFGDGAGAAIIGRLPEGAEGGFIDKVHFGHAINERNIRMDNANLHYADRSSEVDGKTRVDRAYIEMGGGPRILRQAVNVMAGETLAVLGYDADDLKNENPELRATLDRLQLVPHQANGRIVDGIQKKLGLRDEQVYRTIYYAGNLSAATNVVTLDHAMRRGNYHREVEEDGTVRIDATDRTIRDGEPVVLTTIGAGYLYGAVGFVR